MSISEKILRWIPPALWMGLIFFLSSQRSLPGPWWKSVVGHIVEYAVLSSLFWLALVHTTDVKRNTVWLIAALLAAAYGLTDELHQSVVPGRSAEVQDFLIDAAAALAAAYLLSKYYGEKARPYRAM